MQNLIQPHKRKKLFIVLGCCLALFAVGVGVWWFALRDQQEAATTNLSSTASGAVEKTNSSITVAAMGDMLAHDSIVAQAKTADGYDFLPYFTNIKQLYESNDAVFCNPETPAAGATLGISGYPTFNAPTEFVRDLRKTGCSVINLASNHMSDKGQPGIDATIDNWEAQKPLALAGANKTAEAQQQISYFTKNDIKVAFLAFADFSNSTPPHSYSVTLYHDTALVDSLLETARKNADVVLVSAHWGTEDSHTVNDDQKEFTAQLAKHNVDVVIGTGPHVLQPVEYVVRGDGKKMLVWYSIGNMLSSQLKIDELTGGVAQFRITKQDGVIVIDQLAFHPTFMSYKWDAADKQAEDLSARYGLKLQPLQSAAEETKLFGTTVDERMQKVQSWLGDTVTVTTE